MTREDSLQNQVSCFLNLQVNLISGKMKPQKNQGNIFFALFIKYKTGPEDDHFHTQ